MKSPRPRIDVWQICLTYKPLPWGALTARVWKGWTMSSTGDPCNIAKTDTSKEIFATRRELTNQEMFQRDCEDWPMKRDYCDTTRIDQSKEMHATRRELANQKWFIWHIEDWPIKGDSCNTAGRELDRQKWFMRHLRDWPVKGDYFKFRHRNNWLTGWDFKRQGEDRPVKGRFFCDTARTDFSKKIVATWHGQTFQRRYLRHSESSPIKRNSCKLIS